MLFVANIRAEHKIAMTKEEQGLFGIEKLNVPRSHIPAVTHVDYSARIQTVDQFTNQRFHSLIREFNTMTGCPILVNTRFNVRGKPIVCSPTDDFHCFMGSELDVLVVRDFILRKGDQDPALKRDYKSGLEID